LMGHRTLLSHHIWPEKCQELIGLYERHLTPFLQSVALSAGKSLSKTSFCQEPLEIFKFSAMNQCLRPIQVVEPIC
jgi:hypothetical protein